MDHGNRSPPPRDVVEYVRDMAGELAAMAKGAGLADVAKTLAQARERAEDLLARLDSAA